MVYTKKHQMISHNAARELIWSHRVNGQGRTFSVAFLRRTSNSQKKRGHQEVMTGRFGVRKYLKSRGDGNGKGGAAYDRAAKDVFCIFILSRKGEGEVCCYRSIPFDTITWLKLDGTVYRVGQAPPKQH